MISYFNLISPKYNYKKLDIGNSKIHPYLLGGGYKKALQQHSLEFNEKLIVMSLIQL